MNYSMKVRCVDESLVLAAIQKIISVDYCFVWSYQGTGSFGKLLCQMRLEFFSKWGGMWVKEDYQLWYSTFWWYKDNIGIDESQ